MAEFRQWLQEKMARLDGAHARKIVGFGAMAFLIFLSVGPTALQAMADTLASRPPRIEVLPPQTIVTIMPPPTPDATTEAVGTNEEAPAVVEATPTAVPPLAFLFPQAGAALAGPITIAVRVENAKPVGLLFEISDPSGQAVATLSAAPSATGEWSTLFSAAPGTYVANVRASLDDGRVVAFKEGRAFQLLASETAPTPADPSEPLVELIAPDIKNGAYDAIAPLAARVKNAQPNVLVFLVTAPDKSETLVLGSEVSDTGYWTAMFEGGSGDYRVRARATIGEREVFSPENPFTLKTAAD